MSTSVPSSSPPARFIESLGDYLTVDELAEYLQLSKETIYHGRLEGTRHDHVGALGRTELREDTACDDGRVLLSSPRVCSLQLCRNLTARRIPGGGAAPLETVGGGSDATLGPFMDPLAFAEPAPTGPLCVSLLVDLSCGDWLRSL